MIKQIKQFDSLLILTIILIGFIGIFADVYARDPNNFLEWKISTSKQMFYPGEPILLTLNITNTGGEEEKIDLGIDGIEAFSMVIRDSNGIIVNEGKKIQRFGLSKPGILVVPQSKTAQKSIVLNQWCSTLLSPRKYYVTCNIEYRLRSESKRKEGSEIFKAGPLHKTQLGLDIQIVKTDKVEFKKILDTLAGFEVEPKTQSNGEWLAARHLAREMLAFTESELAVPYQLKMLRVEKYTRLKQDIISSLVRSETLEATNGLMQIIEDSNVYKEDIENDSINAVYKLRDKGNPEILSATNEFVAKHKRPIISTGADYH